LFGLRPDTFPKCDRCRPTVDFEMFHQPGACLIGGARKAGVRPCAGNTLMGLAFFEIEEQHAKLHVRGVERDKFTRVQKRYVPPRDPGRQKSGQSNVPLRG
jgi:hypothetical protein